MTGTEVVFWLAAVTAVLSALATITRRNPVVAAVCLVASFFAVAVVYVLLSATFLAAIQVLVYAGAIMVLFVFVVMVLDKDDSGEIRHAGPTRISRYGYNGAWMLLVGFLAWVLLGTWSRQYVTPGSSLDAQPDFGSAQSVGRELFYRYVFAFEAVSLLLLAAVIGAVVVARSRRERDDDASGLNARQRARNDAGLSAKGV